MPDIMIFEIDGKSLWKNWKNRKVLPSKEKTNEIVKLYCRCCDNIVPFWKEDFYKSSYCKLSVKT